MATLADPLRYLKGAGPARARLLERLGLLTLGDLLEHYPRGYLDRSRLTPLGQLQPGPEATAQGRVRSVSRRRARTGRSQVHAIVEDESGVVECIWFNQPYIAGRLQRGAEVLLAGRVDLFRRPRFVNPEFETLDRDGPIAPGIVPVYPLTAGLTQPTLRRLMRQALEIAGGALGEFLPAEILARNGLMPWPEASVAVHFPVTQRQLDAARRRIAFQELFDLQMLIACSRATFERPASAEPLTAPGHLARRLRGALPFALTAAQEKALRQICNDLARDVPMHRLLEGDVGSGKTVVAALAALHAVEAGRQVAVMAPTEILAAQHAATFARLCGPLGLETALLTGGTPNPVARAVRAGIAAGDVAIVLGTHALIQESVSFRHLGLVIVDEQHRFGVLQRARLLGKGPAPHALLMSATPIPRTLALTLFGDLDIAVLDEKPPGRTPPRTHRVKPRRYGDMLKFIAGQLAEGAQAYFVCPAIESSQDVDLKAAEDLYQRLQTTGPLANMPAGLLHGRMKTAQKRSVMEAFARGESKYLVATTVIEVGLDVPNANLMVIEHPERYGLSQLHQLRGRIGRGRQPAHLFLIEQPSIGRDARARLTVLVREHDGFRIAEEDLRQRGPGEFFGVRQSGLPALKMADPIAEPQLLERAREEAFAWMRTAGSEALRSSPLWHRLEVRFGERIALYAVG